MHDPAETKPDGDDKRYRFLFETAGSAILVLDPALTIHEWNPQAERLFGLSRDEAVGESFLERLLPAEARAAAEAAVRGGQERQERLDFETPVLSGDGGQRTVSWSLSRIPDGDGRGERWLAVGNDVTERRRATEALRLNHARWQALGDALSVGVVLLGHGHRILLANTAARRMLEVLDATDRLDVLERLGPLSLEEVLDRHRDEGPVEIRVGEPRTRIFEAKANPVIAGGGGEWVLALSEVTAERETERKLWLRERLAAVGQLAAGIAHDFNNLLQSITLAAEISQPSPVSKDPELAENLDIILHQSDRAAELVRQILDFARQSPTQPQVLDLGPFIEEVVGLLRRTLPEPVSWTLDLGGEHLVRSDPAQLQQLLTNLVVNASAAMPSGGVIRIALGETELAGERRERAEAMERGPMERGPMERGPMEGGPWHTLTVSDTGCGMPPEVRERIFEPFFTTKDRAHGSGLGLAQVYGIVKQQGGFIDVESEVGAGTTFVVYLPVAGDGEVAQAAEISEIEIPEGGGELVLLVEDDPSILRGARMALISFGYQVLSAEDGEAALELHDQHGDAIQLVLTDMAMPGMDGGELVRRLEERGSDAAVLFITGHAARQELDDLAMPEGMECLLKPFSLEELAQAVSGTLRKHRQER